MRKVMIAGIDEAGRGAILGPLAMGIVVASREQEKALLELGVKDSKEIPPKKRAMLVPQIEKIASGTAVIKILPEELNQLMPKKSLNEIEAMKAAALLEGLVKKPDIVIVDSPDIKAENFAERMKKYLSFSPVIKSEHFADANYAVVSSASIIAKVARDLEIELLKKKFGAIGSGYWHDPQTKAFLENWVKKNSSLPDCARDKWQPSITALNNKLQKKLADFK